MWFIVAFLRLRLPVRELDIKFGMVTKSFYWDATGGKWHSIIGTPYRTREEAEVVAVFIAGSIFDQGEASIMSLSELDEFHYGKAGYPG